MPPARRRRRIGPTPDAAVQAAVAAGLEHIATLPTAQARARAATDLISLFEDAKRTIAFARADDVREMLAGGATLTATAQALDLSINAVVQIRDDANIPPAAAR